MSLMSQASNGKKPWYREYGEALLFALILALLIRTFLFQAFKIPSGSMEDTLLVGDHLLVNKFIYGTQLPFMDGRFLTLRDPHRGDIIVFEFPLDGDKSYFQRRDFIKRVVGMPGDKIEVRNKQVLVNGEPYKLLQERHKELDIIPGNLQPRDFMGPIEVPAGHFFVMGDNRDRSFDSRFWGFVPEQKIKGLAFIKYWSWNRETNLPRWNRIGRIIN
ncbi:MAG: signal peptidase I [Desulfuromonadaceae bacterium]|nr:signal peptidase I [Desulfuromonadaceae bacterium]